MISSRRGSSKACQGVKPTARAGLYGERSKLLSKSENILTTSRTKYEALLVRVIK
jgi:hypothetical protein